MHSKGFAKTAILGALVGAAAGILFAPKSGKETRKELRDRFEEIKDEVITGISEAAEFSRDSYHHVIEKVVSGFKEAKKITPEEAEEIKGILEESFDKIESSLAGAKEEVASKVKGAGKKS